jgi:pilus assembly protein CpaB
MWKVKRMNTARIVVLTIAVGAGGTAACLANGPDNKPLLTEPVAQRRTLGVFVAAREIGFGSAVEIRPDDQIPRRGENIDAVRHGVSSPTTIL